MKPAALCATQPDRDVPSKGVDGTGNHLAFLREVPSLRQSESRQSLLMDAGRVLGSSLDHKATLSALCKLAVPRFADWCAVDLFTPDEQIQHIEVCHRDPARVQLAVEFRRRYPPQENKDGALMRVLRTGQPLLCPELTDEMLVKGARDPVHLDMVRSLGLKSVILVPLIARGNTLGAMTLVMAESSYRYGDDDVQLAMEIASRAALAVDNARLFSESRELTRKQEEMLQSYRVMQQNLSLLVEASTTLTASLEPPAVLQAILNLSNRLIAADAYAIWRLNSVTGQWSIGISSNLSEPYQRDVIKVFSESPGPPESVVVAENIDDLDMLRDRKRIYEREGIRSLMVAPLKVRSLLNGTLVFYYRQPHRFSEVERSIATTLANLAAAAIGTAELYEELRQNDAKKDQFLAILAHELRNPLAPISNAVHLLKLPTLADHLRSQAAALVNRQVDQMTHLLNDLLDISRITRGKIELRNKVFDLADAVNLAAEATRPLMGECGHRLDVECPRNTLVVNGDLTRLSQVFTNLLNNAAKYTEKGGTIRLAARKDGSEAVVTIRDNGIGIPPHMLETIFDMFAQVDSSLERSHGGLGIGLTLVKNIIELHKGKVTASSHSEGSEFLVRLPLAEGADCFASTDGESGGQKNPAPLRVLVVDDNDASAKTMGWTLESLGHRVMLANGGPMALNLAQEFCPHVVLLDIGMPGMNGYEACEKMRAIPGLKGTLFVAQTGWGQKEHRERSKKAGFNFHLVKPIDLGALKDILTLAGAMRDDAGPVCAEVTAVLLDREMP